MKQVLITGASRGIGAAAAQTLGAMGYRVWLHYRQRESAAREVAQSLVETGAPAPVLAPFDLAKRAEAAAQTEKLIAVHGVPDALVLNAGVTHNGLLALTDDASWDAVMETNLGGFLAVTRPIVKAMLRVRRGRIVVVSSVAAQRGNAGQVAYAASKGGLISAVKSLALELAPRGITVNAVAPGLIDTEMLSGTSLEKLLSQVPSGRLGTPEEVAHVIGFLCSEDAGYITGQVVSVNGGLWS